MVVFLTNAKYPKHVNIALATCLGGIAKVIQYSPSAITIATNNVPWALGYTGIQYLQSCRVEEVIRLHCTCRRGL